MNTRISGIKKFINNLVSKPAFYMFLIFIIESMLFGKFIVEPGAYGIFSDWPIPPLKEQVKDQVINDVFYAWSPNYLGYERVRQAGNYVDIFALVVVELLDVGGEVISKYPFLLIFLIGQVSYLVLKKFNMSNFSAFVGALFYALCVPLFYNSLISGYLKFLISFLGFPILILYTHWVSESEKFELNLFVKFSLAFIVVSTTLNFFFISYIPILVILFFKFLERKFNYRFIVLILSQLILASVLVVGSQATSFFPPIYDLFKSYSETDPIGSLKGALITFLTFSHPSILNAFRQFSVSINFFEREYPTYGKRLILSNLYFTLLLMIVYGGILFNRKKLDPIVSSLFTLAVLSVFILKGVNQPFGALNLLLYKFPFMAVLRNISYITLLSGFSYAFLLSYSLDNLFRKVGQKIVLNFAIVCISFFLIFMGSYPLRTGKVLELLKTYTPSNEESKLFETIRRENGFFNVYYLPHLSPFIYHSENGEYIGPGFNTFITNPPKPALYSGNVMLGRNYYFDAYLNNTFIYNNSDNPFPLMKLANIKYVIFDKRFESLYPNFINIDDNKWLKSYALNQYYERNSALKELWNNPDFESEKLNVYSINDFKDSKLVYEPKIFLNIGGYSSYEDQLEIFGNTYEGVFGNDYSDKLIKYINFIHFSQTGLEDGILSIVKPKYKYEPGKYVDKNRNKATDDWAQTYRGEFWWYDIKVSDVHDSILIASPEHRTFNMPVSTGGENKYLLFTKLLFSKNGGILNVKFNNALVSSVNTVSEDYSGAKYVYVGEILSQGANDVISFESLGGVNSIYEFTLVPEAEYKIASNTFLDLLSNLPIIIAYKNDSSNGLGVDNKINDFYYARLPQNDSESVVSVNIPKQGKYDLYVLVKNKKSVSDLSLESEYFKIVDSKNSIKQYITVPPDKYNQEICLSTTYVSSKTKSPSNGIPESVLRIQVFDTYTNNILLDESISSSRSYARGDWYTNCFDLANTDELRRSNKNAYFLLSSDSKNVIWGVPYVSNKNDEKGFVIKYQIDGYEKIKNIPFTYEINGKKNNKIIDRASPTILPLGNYEFKAGDTKFKFICEKCDIDKVYLTNLNEISYKNSADYPAILNGNNSNYQFSIHTENNGGILVFKDSYHPKWKLSLDNKYSAQHIVINGFQNGWLVDNEGKEISGTIGFEKQKIYNIANCVSFGIFGALVIVYTATLISRKKNNAKK